jgi:hypothetical protein
VACYEQNSEQTEHDTEIVALEEAANLVRDNSRTSGAAEHSHCAMRLTIYGRWQADVAAQRRNALAHQLIEGVRELLSETGGCFGAGQARAHIIECPEITLH